MKANGYRICLSIVVIFYLLAHAVLPRIYAADNTTNEPPMSIVASTVGRFARGYSWHLSVNSAGQAELTIQKYPEPIRRCFQITQEQMRTLRNEIEKERFFDLADEYGQIVSDGSTDTITVIVGDRVKTVKTRFLGNWDYGDVAKLVEPCRAVRIQILIRGWFEDIEAVDLRKYDQMVIEAVNERDQQSAPTDAEKPRR